jgi:hypothetical protein
MSAKEDDNFLTFQVMAKKLEKDHPHEVVAICDGKVIALAKTYKEALRKAIKQVGNRHVFLHRIGPYDKEAISLF